jgi:hypothetical protein
MKVDYTLPTRVEVFTDAEYGSHDDRKSVMGYVTQIDGNSISYASRKQKVVSLSTTEAEYIAMCEGAKDSVFITQLCKEFCVDYELPILWCDNEASICLSKKPGKHNAMKHVDIKYHYTRSLVDANRLVVKHVGTNEQTADIFTKALERVKFEKFRKMLGVVKHELWMNPN